MTDPIIIGAGDYGYSLSVSLTQEGTKKVLDHYDSVRLLVWDEFRPEDTLWSLPGTVVDAGAGLVQFAVEQGACDVPGVYCCEAELMSGDTARESTDTYRMVVTESPNGGTT